MNENNNEKLFFLVWRNIILKNHIFKFLNGYCGDGKRLFKFGSFKYQEIVSASWLVKNKYFELLKLKVKLGDYLALSYDVSEWGPLKRCDKERGYISLNKLSFYNKEISKDNNLDQVFYKNLFNNYSKYFIENGNFENTISDCLEYDNGIALESLIEIISTGTSSLASSSSSRPTTQEIDYNSLFLKSIEIGSFECGVIIFKNLPKLNESKLKKVWNIVLNDKDDNGNTFDNFGIILNKRSNFLLGKCGLSMPAQSILATYSKSIDPLMYEFPIYQQPLSTLIESVTTIIKFKELFQPLINSIQSKTFKFNSKKQDELKYITICKLINSYSLKLLDIKEIESMNSLFTSDGQLNTLVQDIIKDDSNVMKLYSILLPFTKSNYFIENYTFYKIKYEDDYTNYQSSENHSVTSFHPILFGYYDLEDLKQNGIPLYFGKKYPFYYCAHDNKLKFQYINSLLNDIVNEQKVVPQEVVIQTPWYNKVLNTFLIELVKRDNLELVKFILEFKELVIKFEIKSYSIGLLYNGISSIEMFDLIMGNETFNQESILLNFKENQFLLLKSLILNDKPILLQHYKSTFNKDYFIGIERLNLIEYNDNQSNISVEIYKFIYENLSDFRNCGSKLNVDRYNSINFWHTPTPHHLKSISLEDFKYLVERTPIGIKYNSLSSIFDYSIVNYVYTMYPEDIKSGRFICPGINKLMLKYFKHKVSSLDQDETAVIGKKELKIIHLLKSNAIENLDPIIDIDIGLHANIKFVDILFKNYTGRDQPEYLFYKIFRVACKYGQFSVYKHLESKYSYHFKRVTHASAEESNGSNNTYLLKDPITYGSIEIFQSMIDNFYDGVVPKFDVLKKFGIDTYNSKPLVTYFKLFK